MRLIDGLAYRSCLKYVNPLVKFIISMMCLTVAIGIHDIRISLAIAVILGMITVCAGRIPLKSYVLLLSVPSLFILSGVLAVVLTITKEETRGLFFVLPEMFGYTGYMIGITKDGIYKASELAATSFGAVSCLYFLTLSTPMTDLIYVMQRLHCPALFIELMLLVYRNLFILWEMASDLLRASFSRLGNRNLRTGLKSTGLLLAALFVQSFHRASSLYDAMESRCYDGKIRILYQKRWKKREEHKNAGVSGK